MTKLTHQGACIGLLFLIAACSAPPYAARAIENDAEQTSAVVITDSALHAILRVGAPLLERVPATNQLRVTVPVRNISDDEIQIRAQTSFLDSQRAPTGDDTPRSLHFLSAGQTIYVTVVSMKDGADQFVMRLSYNR